MQPSDAPFVITTLRVKKTPKYPCIYCKENFRTKSILDKHILCCKLVHQQPLIDDNDILSNAALTKIVKELIKEIDTLKKEILSRLPKNKQKIIFIDWLNENRKCNQTFQQFTFNITIKSDLMINLFHDKSVYDIIDKVFKDLPPIETLPIIALEHEPNKFYIFQDNWILATRYNIAKFLNKINIDIYNTFYNWKKLQNKNDLFYQQCDRILQDIVVLDFLENHIAYSKGKTILWKHFKQVFQAITEYDFVYE